ncbi:Hypothetical predicted protein [Paramuricea clavata]|uniref:Uncharacterized protein n=1 Tax=Paramuricea clavata TaxID=317549 RepID=A0A7D9EPF7_PARCT|nr:Hypothetical predicted protein [Paramuricea clavata]
MTQFETLTFESITIANVNHQNLKADEVFAEVGIHLDPKPKATVKASLQTHAKASLKAKVDTGAQGNILPLRLYRAMYPCKIDLKGNPKKGATKHSNTILTAYGGSKLHHHGTVTIDCEFKGKRSAAQFYVTDTQGPAIIGLPTLIDLNLVKFNCAILKQVLHSNTLWSTTRTPEQPPLTTRTPERPPIPKPIKSKEDLIDQYP